MKKTQHNYRINADLARLLEIAAEKSGITKTRILEDALRLYTGGGDHEIKERQEFIRRLIREGGRHASA